MVKWRFLGILKLAISLGAVCFSWLILWNCMAKKLCLTSRVALVPSTLSEQTYRDQDWEGLVWLLHTGYWQGLMFLAWKLNVPSPKWGRCFKVPNIQLPSSSGLVLLCNKRVWNTKAKSCINHVAIFKFFVHNPIKSWVHTRKMLVAKTFQERSKDIKKNCT